MRVPQSYIQKLKVVAHVFQAILIFIAGCLTLAVLTKDGDTGGATKYYIALCCLTGPAIIYLVMVPMWSRAARFASAYAFLAVDALYTILWFAAFISVAVWNSQGIRGGAVAIGAGKNDGNCSTFEYGDASKCKLSRATVGFGVIVFLFFAITTCISGYYMFKFLREGEMPYESKTANPHHTSGETAKDPTWSTEIEPHNNDDDDDEEDHHTDRGGNQHDDEYALLHSTETDEGRHPGRPLSWGTGHRDSYGQPPFASMDDHTNSALSPGGYEEYRREAGAIGPEDDNLFADGAGRKPVGGLEQPYGSGGQGYSFSGGNR
ncbi:hypothetical protein K504DRAFT_457020 [Pleomassaria siparia CBS 279.74]|uniref:MARVEL domain-containing protein n=1 Tax=Pleomassaria siparia CBS 279.74 TaxID=1314801 RepID=A0A6G1KPP3_9PLEO|nr:hypothetical protein K504DRAFT_457020 [Pleomassaria siparia CBS 279.74]